MSTEILPYRWIPCSERMPDKNYDCWVAFKDGTVDRGFWFGSDEVFGRNPYSYYLPENVTHWQLVAPPSHPLAKEKNDNT